MALVEFIFFAIITGFLIMRLNEVLGRRTGEEKNRFKNSVFNNEGIKEEVIESEIQASDLPEEIIQVMQAYPSFNLNKFLEGAKEAFSMIIEAFAKDDRETLKNLLSKRLYSAFIEALEERKSKKEILESTVISIKSVEIKKSKIDKTEISLFVEFVSEQCNILKNSSGEIISGSADYIEEVKDLWVFKRSVRSKFHHWHLAETTPEDLKQE